MSQTSSYSICTSHSWDSRSWLAMRVKMMTTTKTLTIRRPWLMINQRVNYPTCRILSQLVPTTVSMTRVSWCLTRGRVQRMLSQEDSRLLQATTICIFRTTDLQMVMRRDWRREIFQAVVGPAMELDLHLLLPVLTRGTPSNQEVPRQAQADQERERLALWWAACKWTNSMLATVKRASTRGRTRSI